MNDLLGRLLRLSENDAKRDYSCIMIEIPAPYADAIVRFGKKVPDDELYVDPDDPSFGRETDPHVTVRYGSTTNNPNDLKPALAGISVVSFMLGRISFFEADDYDVLKIEVDSEDLHKLNKRLGDFIEFPGETHPDYKPHATIAYLKKGFVKKYVDDETLKTDEPVKVDTVVPGLPASRDRRRRAYRG